MATIPTPPPPLPPLQRPAKLSNSSIPPPPPTNHAFQNSVPAKPPQQNLSASSDELSSLADLIHKDGAPSELVTSSVSTSPTMESDTQDSSKPSTTSEDSHPQALQNDERPPPRSPPPSKGDGVLSTSSMASSPRRPRRMGTGIPENTRVSDLDFEVSDDIGVSARDEFEEEFLNRHPGDQESQIISDVLERVDFRQLSDDEEMLSDDAADPSTGESAARRVNERSTHSRDRMYDSEYVPMDHLPRIRQSTVRSHWRRIPSEVGCEGCEGCSRLCEENRKLRRQLDELEFELASGALHNPPDGFDSPPLAARATPAVPQLPMLTKKKSGWANKLRNATMLPANNSSKPSERTRLRAEVQALTVTTEYLWRKLNKAENELRNYRVKDLRSRMELSAAQNPTDNRDGATSRERQLDLVGDADWDWE